MRRAEAGDFPELAVDVFAGMDRGAELGPDEIKGRNTWNLWCGGDEHSGIAWRRWLRLFDLLKTIDSRKRAGRLEEFGLINQPDLRKLEPDQYGLWIDEGPNRLESIPRSMGGRRV